MTDESDSYRQVLRASFITGGGSALNILIGLVKTKFLAVALEPSGIGLIGLYTTIMSTASAIAGCGLNASGVRRIAEVANKKDDAVGIVSGALWTTAVALGIIGALSLWLLREHVARWVFGDANYSEAVGWLSIGVFFSLIGGAYMALLNGLRRIGDMARAAVIGAFVSMVVALLAVWLFGRNSILIIVVSAPIISFIVLRVITRGVPGSRNGGCMPALFTEARGLLLIGLAVMGADVLSNVTQLLVRLIINRELGMAEAGYFQAATTISITYIGFVLAALSTDFYPRLAAVIHDRRVASELVNQQTQVALLLAGPVVLAMSALAPWLIEWLYAPSFRPAADVLRWQLIGDALRVASWPLGLIPLAAGHAGLFFLFQSTWSIAYLAIVIICLPQFGIEATGMAFLLTYALYMSLVYASALRQGMVWSKGNMNLLITLGMATLLIVGAALWSPWLSMIGGVAISLAYSIYSLKALTALADLRGLPLRIAIFLLRQFRLNGRNQM